MGCDDVKILPGLVMSDRNVKWAVWLDHSHHQALRERPRSRTLFYDLPFLQNLPDLAEADPTLLAAKDGMVAPLDAAGLCCLLDQGKIHGRRNRLMI